MRRSSSVKLLSCNFKHFIRKILWRNGERSSKNTKWTIRKIWGDMKTSHTFVWDVIISLNGWFLFVSMVEKLSPIYTLFSTLWTPKHGIKKARLISSLYLHRLCCLEWFNGVLRRLISCLLLTPAEIQTLTRISSHPLQERWSSRVLQEPIPCMVKSLQLLVSNDLNILS